MPLPNTMPCASKTGDYVRFEQTGDKSVYVHEHGHSDVTKDSIEFSRTAPRPRGNFLGVRRSKINTHRDTTVSGLDGADLKVPQVIKTEFSRPVGVTETEWVKLILDHVSAILGLPAVILGTTTIPNDTTMLSSSDLLEFYRVGEL